MVVVMVVFTYLIKRSLDLNHNTVLVMQEHQRGEMDWTLNDVSVLWRG